MIWIVSSGPLIHSYPELTTHSRLYKAASEFALGGVYHGSVGISFSTQEYMGFHG